MSEYLSKEEIKQWRSSLEKITLEEYAARLGKKLEQDKPTNDLVDIVLKHYLINHLFVVFHLLFLFSFRLFIRSPQTTTFPFLHFFFLWMVLVITSCTML